jgi:hypothetical protein
MWTLKVKTLQDVHANQISEEQISELENTQRFLESK